MKIKEKTSMILFGYHSQKSFLCFLIKNNFLLIQPLILMQFQYETSVDVVKVKI